MTIVKYSVANMSCEHCVRAIQNELSDVPGVQFVKADSSTKSVEVTFEPPATEERLTQLLAEINYPVVGREG